MARSLASPGLGSAHGKSLFNALLCNTDGGITGLTSIVRVPIPLTV